ncbi:Bifunctional purine biosynthesis protein PurH [Posidoniimonas polymericola]|uniref:Bifunctional purine biosynthesis protein PurH n=1 Tax=Posidoniimonas polymericola TaxID=2528002 RepID=A0A5C5XSN8_9BACT|nr:bifunctional phosphoribosylaminoimidazolecarboxamide formyltransferase/IMP cyclohydrolase [Posidoniimonas polymericola]TWT65934.1 Bifunctional purine biosynthesis protein PurH [Posidoniimonas polymericola]
MESPKIKRALISVSDKSGLAQFAKSLADHGVELCSTGGSRKALEDAGIPVRDVTDYTGFPEMMDGRLKTLHPKVHGGILQRRDNESDVAAAEEHGILPFELVVVNLYPFRETIARPDVTVDEAIEKIDIGGPTMVRAAAKNHAFVTIASNPGQYDRILAEVQATGATTPELRRALAGEAFAHTAEYDTAIAGYFAKLAAAEGDDLTPAELSITVTKKCPLRYGENPHQSAALYVNADAGPTSLVNAEQLNGKELSYNNLLDLDAALGVARSLPVPGVAVLKHNNPCGAATALSVGDATRKAWDGDPVSAFGSILGYNTTVDAASAECLAEPGKFVEAIVAPDFTTEAIEILTTKPKWRANVRLLKVGEVKPGGGELQLRAIDGGYLAQAADDMADDESEWKVVTETQPSDAQLAELRFAWAACRHVKSNAIVLSQDNALVGVGAGQMSRVDSVEISIKKAGDRVIGAVMASDAFFPFDDSIHTAAAAGVKAFIQPGGSRNDDQVIAACNKHGLPMVFTGTRHFRH